MKNSKRKPKFLLIVVIFLTTGLLVATLLSPNGAAAQIACTVEWAVDADGDWGAPTNWSTGVVPTATDNVCIDRPGIDVTVTVRDVREANSLHATDALLIISSGSLSLFQPSDLKGDFTLSGGRLNAQGGLDLSGTSIWQGGRINGSVSFAGTLNMSGTKYLGGSLTTSATNTIRQSGSLFLDLGSSVTNNGLYEFAGWYEAVIGPSSSGTGATPVFTNYGTLRQPTYVMRIRDIIFNNPGGLIEVLRGTLSLWDNPGSFPGSPITVASGAQLDIRASPDATYSGTYLLSGEGALNISGTFDASASRAIFEGAAWDGGVNVSGTFLVGTVGARFDIPRLNLTGTLVTEIGGRPETGQFGKVDVTGIVTLAGTLEDILIDGFVPILGDVYPIMTFDGHEGTFAKITLLEPFFEAEYTDTALYLRVLGQVNEPPVAEGDVASTDEDTPATINVLGNDSDPDNDPLTVTNLTQPANGSAAVNADQTVTYTPDPEFFGTDSFTYTANDGEIDSNTASVTVEVLSVNDPPAVMDDAYITDEDVTLIVDAPGVLYNDTDEDGGPLTAVKDSDPSHGTLKFNNNGSLEYIPNANYCGPDSFTYHANDGQADSNVVTVSIHIVCVNDAPGVTTDQANVAVDEGQTANNTGKVTDVDGDTVTLTASVGTVANNNDDTWSWSFATSDGPADSQTVTITADDGKGGTAQTTFELTVNNVAPSVNSILVPLDPVNINDQSMYTIDVTFSDPAGVKDEPYTCDFDLDNDGTNDAMVTGVTSTSCSTQLNYAEAGVYTVKVTVSDKDGGSGTATATEFIVAYDPSAGFVTGGGWILSPEGACQFEACTNDTIGKATFGFVSKHKKGATTPTGQTEFQFKAGNLNFHSDSYQWLVLAGPNAKYKGVGTINGSGNYGFMLTAKDSEINGGGDVDTFRIKIWDKDNGDAVVYDNKMGAGDDLYDGTELGGGNIKIHKGK
jgi:hypothetical protein